MVTLFQLHSNIDDLKPLLKEISTLWTAGDSILLLGETGAFIDWFDAYIADINADDESQSDIAELNTVYILHNDVQKFNDSTLINLDIKTPRSYNVEVLNDFEWVQLTQKFDKTVTITR